MNTDTMTLPEVEILAASSPEQLLEEVMRSRAKGFQPRGPAYFEGPTLPCRQMMVRGEAEVETREKDFEILMK